MDPSEANLLPIGEQWKLAAKQLLHNFGLAAVEKTKRAIDRLAVDQVKDAYRNMTRMASALGLSTQALGLDGHFGLTLRRESKRYLGAFYPKGRESMEGLGETREANIVLPGRSNSFAHEWGHALDYFLFSKFQPDAKQVRGGMSGFVETVRGKGLLKKGATSLDPMQVVARRWADVMEAIAWHTDDDGNRVPTAYLTEAENMDVESGEPDPYWKAPHEMFARAFEAFVAHKVTEAAEMDGMESGTEFITKNDALYQDGAGPRFRRTFPKAEERARIFAKMDELMTAVQQVPELVGPAALDEESVFQPSAWARLIGPEQRQDPKIMSLFKSSVSHIALAGRFAGKTLVGIWRGGKYLLTHPLGALGESASETLHFIDEFPLRSMVGVMRAIQNRTGSQALDTLIDHFAPLPGSNKYVRQTYEEARVSQLKTFKNVMARIARRFSLMKITPDENAYLRDLLTSGGSAQRMTIRPPEGISDLRAAELREAASQIRALTDKMFYYAREAGLEIGHTKNGYLPRDYVQEEVDKDSPGFDDAAQEVYKIVWDRDDDVPDIEGLLDDTSEKTWQEFLTRAKDVLGKDHPDYQDLRAALRAYRNAVEDDEGVDEALQALTDALDATYDQVRDGWSRKAAQAWRQNIQAVGTDSRVDNTAPPAGFTKTRALPPEADRLMAKFMEKDVMKLLSRYAAQITRKAEITRRFGARNEVANQLFADMLAEGMPREDINKITAFYERVTGQDYRPNSRWKSRGQVALDSVYALQSAGMLAFALFTNLMEPVSIALRTGRLGDLAWRAPRNVVSEGIVASQDVIERWLGIRIPGMDETRFHRELSMMTGAIADTATEQMIGDRLSSAMQPSEWVQKMTAGWFEKTGLAGYTRWSRSAASRVGVHFLHDLSERLLGTYDSKNADKKSGDVSELVIQNMNELGIPPSRREDFARFMTEVFYNDGKRKLSLPQLEDHPMWPILQTALLRFTDASIQEPGRILKPFGATSPWFHAFYGLQSFAYAFNTNIVMRAVRMLAGPLVQGVTLGKFQSTSALTKTQAAGMLVKGIPLLIGVFMAHAIATFARSWAIDDERKRAKLLKGFTDITNGKWTAESKTLLYTVLARTGFLGPSERFVNQAMAMIPATQDVGGRYEVDFFKTAVGPAWGSILSAGNKITGAFPGAYQNSDNTTTKEFRASQAVYDTVKSIALPMLLGSMPGGIVTGGLAIYNTRPAARDQQISKYGQMEIPKTEQERKDESAAKKAYKETPEGKAGGEAAPQGKGGRDEAQEAARRAGRGLGVDGDRLGDLRGVGLAIDVEDGRRRQRQMLGDAMHRHAGRQRIGRPGVPEGVKGAGPIEAAARE
jgi:hypothetical protein